MKAIFFDRDGTLIKDKNYLNAPQNIEILPGVIQGLKSLKEKGFTFFIVTNQSGIARGYLTVQTLEQIHRSLKDKFAREKIFFKEVFYCPHYPDDNCKCRKPKTGLVDHIFKKYKITRKWSFSIGDKDSDIKFGKNLGLKTVGLGKESQFKEKPDFRTENFLEAINWVIKNSS